MVWTSVRVGAWLEVAVMLFQALGLLSLCLNRLGPRGAWAERGRVWFVVSLIGLGVAGALCGRHDSEFSLFAGGTLTLLLIGMTTGSGHSDTTVVSGRLAVAEPNLAA
jgi:hypothetical protein